MTVAALLEADYELPCMDYTDLFKLTKIITRNNKEDMEQMYKRMCFNIYAHNYDDHVKNFSYIYDQKNDKFSLSPAYDLTYSTTYYGEHTTSVNGKGINITDEDLIKLGTEAGLTKKYCTETAAFIKEIIKKRLKEWM